LSTIMPPGKLRFTPLDGLLLALVALGVGALAWRAVAGLDYDWSWRVIGQFLVRYDEATSSWKPNLLLLGLMRTIKLALWATVLALGIGLVMGLCRTARPLFPQLVGGAYVNLIRNLPPLVLVFIFYFFLSEQVLAVLRVEETVRGLPEGWQSALAWLAAPPRSFPSFAAAVMTMAVYEGAYITEIVRAGIQSIEKGQWEASFALGLTPYQTMRHVVLPLTAQRIMPPLAGQFISTIKDSSIVAVISVQELTFQGLEIMASTYRTFEIWTTVAVLYLCLTLTCSLLTRKLEVYLRRSEA